MLGRELIVYILENHLENVDIFDKEFFKHFPTVETVAARYKVGTATVQAWLDEDYLQGFEFDGQVYIIPSSLEEFAKIRV